MKMKKLLAITLSLLLVVTTSISFASSDKKGLNGKGNSVSESRDEKKDEKKALQELWKNSVRNSVYRGVYNSVYKNVYKNAISDLKDEIKDAREDYHGDRKEVKDSIKDLRTVYKSVYNGVYKKVYQKELASEIDSLRDELATMRVENKNERKALMLKIAELRKAKNDHSMPVFVNGKEVKFDVPPVIKDGRTLIPVNAVATSLGADVKWDAQTRTVSITKTVNDEVSGDTNIVILIKLDSNIILINGKETLIDVPAQIHNNRTVVPIRAIMEALLKDVEWDAVSGSIVIDDKISHKKK